MLHESVNKHELYNCASPVKVLIKQTVGKRKHLHEAVESDKLQVISYIFHAIMISNVKVIKVLIACFISIRMRSLINPLVSSAYFESKNK